MLDKQKIWFITGASSGMGYALAKSVIETGDIAVIGARRLDKLQALAYQFKNRVMPIQLDVTNPESRQKSVEATINQFGRIDVLANIAGRGINGAAEELDIEQTKNAFEINFFSAIELTRLILPYMRKQRSGHIINMTSICGLVPLADLSAYGASKFALEAWSESLYQEVKHLGIRLTLVEPGAFRTEFEGESIVRPQTRIVDYSSIVDPIESALMNAAGKQIGDPIKAAKLIIAAVEDKTSPLHLVLGSDAFSLWNNYLQNKKNDIKRWEARGAKTDYS